VRLPEDNGGHREGRGAAARRAALRAADSLMRPLIQLVRATLS